MSTSIIDDSDASQVKYLGAGWTKGGTSHEHAGTVTSSTSVGDSFSVTFTGTSIGVFGTLDSTSGGVVTSYSVDGAPEAQVTLPAGSGDTYNQQFWQSPQLSPQQHNLVVKMIKVNPSTDPGEGTVWFDYFQVSLTTQSSAISGVPTGSSVGTSSPSLTSSSSQSTQSGSSSGLPTVFTKKKGPSVAPIVGGIVAVILLVALLATFIVLFRRRRSARNTPSKPPKPEIDASFTRTPGYMPLPLGNSQINIVPHVNGPGRMQTNQAQGYRPPPPPASIPRSSLSTSNYSAPAGQSVLYYHDEGQSSSLAVDQRQRPSMSAAVSVAPSTTVPSRPSVSKDSKSANPSLTLAWVPEPVQHVDSGLRVVNNPHAVQAEELPPVYSAQ